MPVSVTWDDIMPTVIVIHFVGSWTWEEYYLMGDSLEELLAEKPEGSVHVIVDFLNSNVLPGGLFTHFQRTARDLHSSIGLIVMVAISGPLKSVISVLMRLFPQIAPTIHYADSITDARRLIASKRHLNTDND